MARILLVFCGLVFLAGCATTPAVETEGGFDVWAASDLENVRTDAAPMADRPSLYNSSQRTLELSAAVNETAATQIVIYAKEHSLSNVEVQAGDLVGPNLAVLPASNLTLYRALYAPQNGFASWRLLTSDQAPVKTDVADCLVPLGTGPLGRKITIAGKHNQPIWLDVHVPKGLPAGTYTGTLRILAEGAKPFALTLKLTVLDLSLPEEPTLPVAAGLDLAKLWQGTLRLEGKTHVPPRMVRSDPTFERARAVLADTCRVLKAHGLSPMLKGLYPALSTTAQGALDVDFADATALLTPPEKAAGAPATSQPTTEPTLVDQRNLPLAPSVLDGNQLAQLPFEANFPDPNQYNGPDSREYREAVRVYLQFCRSWLLRAAPRSRQVLDLTEFTQPTAPTYQRLLGLASIARGADPESWIGVAEPTLPLAPVGWAGHYYQALDLAGLLRVPPAEWLDPTAIPALLAKGQHVGLQPTQPPFSPGLAIEADSADPVALAWVAWRYRLKPLWLGEVADWPEDPLHGTPADASARYLIYPPASEEETAPYPSIRLKRLRRGLQDHAYLTLLSRLAAPNPTAGVKTSKAGETVSRMVSSGSDCADQLARLLVPFACTESYGENYRDARPGGWSHLPEHYLLATELIRAGLDNGYRGRALWPADSLELAKLKNEREKLRVEVEGVRLSPKPGNTEQVVAEFGLFLRNELDGPVEARVKFGPLPAGWKADTDQVNAGRLNLQESRRLGLHADALTLPGGRGGAFYQPILVQTDMGWRTTVAARVAVLAVPLLTKPPTVDGDLSDWPVPLANMAGDFRLPGRNAGVPDLLNKPDNPTTALLAHDGKNLYVGITAQEPENTPRQAVTNNQITHSGLLAWDEDLVQILFDPGSRGSGDASDLYVLTIKPTGAVVARRGADVWPPIGQSAPWATNAKVAVQSTAKGWTAEVMIPLADFGPGADKLRFWGFDVVRHDTSTGQSSNWSGCGRHFYNTRSMGNLVILWQQ